MTGQNFPVQRMAYYEMRIISNRMIYGETILTEIGLCPILHEPTPDELTYDKWETSAIRATPTFRRP